MTTTAEKTDNIPMIDLNNGVSMPQIGYGVFQITDPDQCRNCVREAIDKGYRLFDTASAYYNEEAVGEACLEAVEDGRIRREDLFLETKVWLSDFGDSETVTSVQNSMKKLKTDYLDLVVLHQPFGKWKEAWKTLENLQKDGIIRAIGISNFNRKKTEELLNFAEVIPQVDQIEMHPFYSEQDLFDYLKEKKIQPQAWGPFSEGLRDIFRNPVLTEIGAAHGKTAAQTALRWNIQRGAAVIPKATVTEHMKEDLDIFDFELSDEEMKQISAMDIGHSEIIDFESPATERLLKKLHVYA